MSTAKADLNFAVSFHQPLLEFNGFGILGNFFVRHFSKFELFAFVLEVSTNFTFEKKQSAQ